MRSCRRPPRARAHARRPPSTPSPDATRDVPFAASPRLSEPSPWTRLVRALAKAGEPEPHSPPRAGGRDFEFVLGTGTRGARSESRVAISPWAYSLHELDGVACPAGRRRKFPDTPTVYRLQRLQLRIRRPAMRHVWYTYAASRCEDWEYKPAVYLASMPSCEEFAYACILWSQRLLGSTWCFVRPARSWVYNRGFNGLGVARPTMTRCAQHACAPGQFG